MTVWKRSLRMSSGLRRWIATVRAVLFHGSLPYWRNLERRLARPPCVRLGLEILEERVVPTSSFGGVGATTVLNNPSQIPNQATAASVVLVNDLQQYRAQYASLQPQFIAATVAQLQQWNAVLNTINAEWSNGSLQQLVSQEMAALMQSPLGQNIDPTHESLAQLWATVQNDFNSLFPGILSTAFTQNASGQQSQPSAFQNALILEGNPSITLSGV